MTGEVLMIAEHRAGVLSGNTADLAAFARKLAGVCGTEARAVALAAEDTIGEEVAARTGLPVLVLEHSAFGLYNAETYLCALAPLVRELQPRFVVVEHSAVGWDFGPRLSVRTAGGWIPAVSGVEERPLRFRRPVLGGKMEEEVQPAAERMAVVSVLPAAVEAGRSRNLGYKAAVVSVLPAAAVEAGRSRNLGYKAGEPRSVDLSRAEVIVAAGRGLGRPESLDLIRELATAFKGSAVGASRPVVDAGWLAYEHQVGMTGQTVAPRLYIACGISGALQHVIGMSRSELVVAVNLDPQAPIFQVAQIGVVKDLHEFLPALLQKLRQNRP